MAINIPDRQKRRSVFFFVFTAWWCVWILLHTLLLVKFGTAPSTALIDSVTTYVLLAVMCVLINNNMRYYLPRGEKYLYVFIISIAFSTFWLLLMHLALWGMYKKDPIYMEMLSKTSNVRYAIAFLMVAASTLLSLLWHTQKEQNEDNLRMIDTERLAREAELNKLRQQLQPHFLFNSLNSISALTGTQPEKARHMIQQLADFLRGTLKKEEERATVFRDELLYLQLYLDIEKVRFGYRLQTSITCSDEALEMVLPTMLLQPLVENAIKFGLYDTIGEVVIFISAVNTNGMLEVAIKNPFDESTAGEVKGTGFGLSSIRRRLFLLFGRHDLLLIQKDATQFTTRILIPQTT